MNMVKFEYETMALYDKIFELYDKEPNGDVYTSIIDAILRYFEKIKNRTAEDNAIDIEARQLIRDIHRILGVPFDKNAERNREIRNSLGQLIFGILEELAQ